MNNDKINKIKLIKELLIDIEILPLALSDISKMEYYLNYLKTTYERTISLSSEIIDDKNKDKIELQLYFSQYPFVEEHKWKVAKDKLRSFLAKMRDEVQFEGIIKFNFWILIHENIIIVSKKRFEDEHYADSVESAMKAVNKRVKNTVKNKTSKEYDGKSLMHEAFSPKNPIIILDDSSSESGKNVQEGYMHIFAGAMQGIRNPKAHDNLSITRERAIHQLFLASLLMYKLDEGKS